MISLFTPSLFIPPSPTSPSLVNELRGTLKSIMFPAHRSFADPYNKKMIF